MSQVQVKRWNMRPPRGVREKDDYRNSGTGHEINLEMDLKKIYIYILNRLILASKNVI